MFKPEFFIKHNDFITLAMYAYGTKNRLYHTTCHIFNMVSKYNQFIEYGVVEYDEVMVLAILAHDIVYDVRKYDNEEESSMVLCQYMRSCGYSEDEIERANRLVLKTKTHSFENSTDDIIIDLDLWSLGAPKDVYLLNAAGIRREYIHLSDEEWIEGRIAWLTSFIGRDRLFSTSYIDEKRELRARENMNYELKHLVH